MQHNQIADKDKILKVVLEKNAFTCRQIKTQMVVAFLSEKRQSEESGMIYLKSYKKKRKPY